MANDKIDQTKVPYHGFGGPIPGLEERKPTEDKAPASPPYHGVRGEELPPLTVAEILTHDLVGILTSGAVHT